MKKNRRNEGTSAFETVINVLCKALVYLGFGLAICFTVAGVYVPPVENEDNQTGKNQKEPP